MQADLSALLDEDFLEKALTTIPAPAEIFRARTPVDAHRRLLAVLGELFLPDQQSVRVAKEIVALAISFSESEWRDPARYQARLYEAFEDKSVLDEAWWPMSLCGHAGVGKSTLLKHLMVLIESMSSSRINIAGFPEPVESRVLTYATFTPGSTHSSILHHLGGIPAEQAKRAPKGAQLLAYVTQTLSRANTCVAILDESQFRTLSTDAYAMISRNLMLPITLRVASVATLNFSLYNRLLKAPPQLGDRFFSFPLLITPPNRDSKEWEQYCEALGSVLGSQLAFNPVEQQLDLWNLCLGIKRYAVKLLGIAAGEASSEGKDSIQWSQVVEAYRSQAFGQYRATIETISREAITNVPERNSQTWCPFQKCEAASHNYYQGIRASFADNARLFQARGALTPLESHTLQKTLRKANPGNDDLKPKTRKRTQGPSLEMWQKAARDLQNK